MPKSNSVAPYTYTKHVQIFSLIQRVRGGVGLGKWYTVYETAIHIHKVLSSNSEDVVKVKTAHSFVLRPSVSYGNESLNLLEHFRKVSHSFEKKTCKRVRWLHNVVPLTILTLRACKPWRAGASRGCQHSSIQTRIVSCLNCLNKYVCAVLNCIIRLNKGDGNKYLFSSI